MNENSVLFFEHVAIIGFGINLLDLKMKNKKKIEYVCARVC